MTSPARLRHEAPFFGSASTFDAPSRRLLLLSHCFPPDREVGALRWQKMAGLAVEHGFTLDVITLDPAAVAHRDDSRLADLPSSTRVFGVPEPDLALRRWERRARKALRREGRDGGRAGTSPPGASARRTIDCPTAVERGAIGWWPRSSRDLVRAYCAWLYQARHAGWARAAATLGVRLAAQTSYAAVVTSGPPHMSHVAGRTISRTAGIPLMMDMRDPWSMADPLPEEVASPLTLRWSERYERQAIEQASIVAVTAGPLAGALKDRYPSSTARFITVMNGCDDEPLPEAQPSARFVIAYAGSLYLDRDPRLLFRAAARLVREMGLRPSEFGFEFIGDDRLGSTPITRIAEEEGIAPFVRVGPARPRADALRFLAGAPMLVSLPQRIMAVPAKLFEYARFPAWVLALTDRGSATDMLLRDTGADVVAPDDVAGIAAAIGRRVREHANGVRPLPLCETADLGRRTQAARLFEAINACLAR